MLRCTCKCIHERVRMCMHMYICTGCMQVCMYISARNNYQDILSEDTFVFFK